MDLENFVKLCGREICSTLLGKAKGRKLDVSNWDKQMKKYVFSRSRSRIIFFGDIIWKLILCDEMSFSEVII